MKNYYKLYVLPLLLMVAVTNSEASAGYNVADSTITLKEFDVTSRKISKELSSPTGLYEITNSELDQLGITGISDAMHRLPGVTLHDYGGAGGMKTVSVRGLGTQHTGVAYDGIPLSDVQSGQIDLARYTPDNLSSLSLSIGDNEDIFVPARTAASAATIYMSSWQSIKPGSPLELSAFVKTGSFGLINPSIGIASSLSDKTAIHFSGNYLHADNRYSYTIPNGSTVEHAVRKNSGIDSGNAEVNFQWLPTPDSRLLAKVYYYNSYQHLPGPAILYNDESNQTLKDVNIFGQINYRGRLSRLFSLNTYLKYNWSNTIYHDAGGEYSGGYITNKYNQQEEYASATLLCTPFTGFSASYSLDYFHNSLRSNLKQYSTPGRHSILQSLNIRYRVKFLTVTGRLLLSVYHDTPGDTASSMTRTRLSPSIGISVKPIANQNLFLRCNYKNIFRMPTFNELYFDHYGTLNLEPEITDQISAGITYGLNDKGPLASLNITVDGYFNKIINKIVAVPYNMFVWTMTNMGKVHSYGIDFTLNTEITLYRNQRMLIAGNYSWQRALGKTSRDKLDWDKQLPYTPEHSGAASIAWENPYLCLQARVFGCSYRFSTKENVASSKMPGYVDTGFAIYHTFNFHGHSLELRADLINAFNAQYEVVARYPMPGRSWMATIKFYL